MLAPTRPARPPPRGGRPATPASSDGEGEDGDGEGQRRHGEGDARAFVTDPSTPLRRPAHERERRVEDAEDARAAGRRPAPAHPTTRTAASAATPRGPAPSAPRRRARPSPADREGWSRGWNSAGPITSSGCWRKDAHASGARGRRGTIDSGSRGGSSAIRGRPGIRVTRHLTVTAWRPAVERHVGRRVAVGRGPATKEPPSRRGRSTSLQARRPSSGTSPRRAPSGTPSTPRRRAGRSGSRRRGLRSLAWLSSRRISGRPLHVDPPRETARRRPPSVSAASGNARRPGGRSETRPCRRPDAQTTEGPLPPATLPSRTTKCRLARVP